MEAKIMEEPSLMVAFDIAGTLIVDTGIITRSFSQALGSAGIKSSKDEIEEWRGAAKTDVIAHFVNKQFGQGSAQAKLKSAEAYSNFRRLLEESYRNETIEAIDGAEATIRWLKSRRILTATTTGFYRQVRDLILEKMGWDGDFFDCNVSSDDVTKGRPAPYMIFRCMSLLGVADVSKVIVVGDTPLDLKAGCNAGCGGVVGVLTGSHSIESLGMERHTHIITSVASLPTLIEKEFL